MHRLSCAFVRGDREAGLQHTGRRREARESPGPYWAGDSKEGALIREPGGWWVRGGGGEPVQAQSRETAWLGAEAAALGGHCWDCARRQRSRELWRVPGRM